MNEAKNYDLEKRYMYYNALSDNIQIIKLDTDDKSEKIIIKESLLYSLKNLKYSSNVSLSSIHDHILNCYACLKHLSQYNIDNETNDIIKVFILNLFKIYKEYINKFSIFYKSNPDSILILLSLLVIEKLFKDMCVSHHKFINDDIIRLYNETIIDLNFNTNKFNITTYRFHANALIKGILISSRDELLSIYRNKT